MWADWLPVGSPDVGLCQLFQSDRSHLDSRQLLQDRLDSKSVKCTTGQETSRACSIVFNSSETRPRYSYCSEGTEDGIQWLGKGEGVIIMIVSRQRRGSTEILVEIRLVLCVGKGSNAGSGLSN